MSYEYKGTIHAIPPARDGKYHSFVVKAMDGKFEQFVPFDCKGDHVAGLTIGDEVRVTFELSGREWTNPKSGEVRYFGGNRVRSVDVTKRADAVPPPEPNGGGWSTATDDDGSIPF